MGIKKIQVCKDNALYGIEWARKLIKTRGDAPIISSVPEQRVAIFERPLVIGAHGIVKSNLFFIKERPSHEKEGGEYENDNRRKKNNGSGFAYGASHCAAAVFRLVINFCHGDSSYLRLPEILSAICRRREPGGR